MKILKVEQFTAFRVVTDEKDYPEYTRYSPESWTNRMGESDEQFYECGELEVEFQRVVRSGNPGPK